MVFGTGERTIGLCAALTLVAGLTLSAAPAAYAAETPTEVPQDPATATTTDGDDSDDGEPEDGAPEYGESSLLNTPMQTPEEEDEPAPTEDPDPESDEPTLTEDPGPESDERALTESPDPESGNASETGSVPPDPGTPDPDPTTPTGSPAPEPDPTTPTGSPTLEPEPTTPTNGEDDTGDGGGQSQDDDDQFQQEQFQEEQSEPAIAELSCEAEGGLLAPGASQTVQCTVTGAFTIAQESDSALGATVFVDGHEGIYDVIYTAPRAVDGTPQDSFTVVAVDDSTGETATDANGDPVSVRLQFTIDGDTGTPGPSETPAPTTTDDDANGGDSPSPDNGGSPPPESPDGPGATDDTGDGGSGDQPAGETETDTGDNAVATETPTPEGEQGSETSASETNAEAPDSSPSSLRLPIPGAPASVREDMAPAPQSGGPSPSLTNSAAEDDDTGTALEADESNDDGDSSADDGLLAQTGPEQVAWSGSFALAALVLGIAALRLSWRQSR